MLLENVLQILAQLKESDSLSILCDEDNEDIALDLAKRAIDITKNNVKIIKTIKAKVQDEFELSYEGLQSKALYPIIIKLSSYRKIEELNEDDLSNPIKLMDHNLLAPPIILGRAQVTPFIVIQTPSAKLAMKRGLNYDLLLNKYKNALRLEHQETLKYSKEKYLEFAKKIIALKGNQDLIYKDENGSYLRFKKDLNYNYLLSFKNIDGRIFSSHLPFQSPFLKIKNSTGQIILKNISIAGQFFEKLELDIENDYFDISTIPNSVFKRLLLEHENSNHINGLYLSNTNKLIKEIFENPKHNNAISLASVDIDSIRDFHLYENMDELISKNNFKLSQLSYSIALADKYNIYNIQGDILI